MDWQAQLADFLETDLARYFLVPGLLALGLALLGWRQERRRKLRTNLDAVSWVPWISVTFWASFAALILLSGAARIWLKG